MFEFLAPPRRAGRPQPHPALPQPKPHPSADSSYQDRVFWLIKLRSNYEGNFVFFYDSLPASFSVELNDISNGVMTLARSFNLTFDDNRLEYNIIERVANENCEEEKKFFIF